MANRRAFLAGMIATGLAPTATWADVGNPAFLSAGRRPDGTFVLCGLSDVGDITFALPLPARGHAAAAHPTRAEAVAFARRPGTFAIVLDCLRGTLNAELRAPEGRHFYGHGAFSRDGALLFTTENDFDAGRGMVGVWDAQRGYQRIGDFPSGGVGPHDVKRLPGSETLVVANGGIETHPETGRTKLNIPTMRPNISYMTFDGVIADKIELASDFRKNSIRHLAVAQDGTVAFAMQWQGELSDHPPLLGIHRIGARAELSTADPFQNSKMQGYAGSVAILEPANNIAITSPKGGVCQVFDTTSLGLVHSEPIRDVCGASTAQSAFVLTNGSGEIARLSRGDFDKTATHAIQWDNHLVAISEHSL